MLNVASERARELSAVFVTVDDSLKAQARKYCPNTHFVSRPDILVTAFNRIARRG
jgi:hypothetical protein